MNININKKMVRKYLFLIFECYRIFFEFFILFIIKRIYFFVLFMIIFININNFLILLIIIYGNYIISLLAYMDYVNKYVFVNK